MFVFFNKFTKQLSQPCLTTGKTRVFINAFSPRTAMIKPQTKIRRRNKGAAIIELAICLPVLLLIVFGTVELSTSIFLQQTLTSAAHEGALRGMQGTANELEVIEKVNDILTVRGVTDCTVTVEPSGPAFFNMGPGEFFSISIQKEQTNQYLNISGVSVTVTSQRQ